MINTSSQPLGSPAPLVLDAGCDLRGTLHIAGDLRLLGSFHGTLYVSGLVEVGPEATLRGSASVGRLRVRGRVDASVEATVAVVLCPGGELRGAVRTPSLQTAGHGGDGVTRPSPEAVTTEALQSRAGGAAEAAAPGGAPGEDPGEASAPAGVLHRRRRPAGRPAALAGAGSR